MHTRYCLRKRGGTKSKEKSANEELSKKTWKGQRANEEEEKEEKAARGAHGQVMEENFAVAQKQGERAARGAHEESPQKTWRDKEQTKMKKKWQEVHTRKLLMKKKKKKKKRQEVHTGKCGRKLRGGTERRRKSGKRCTRGIA